MPWAISPPTGPRREKSDSPCERPQFNSNSTSDRLEAAKKVPREPFTMQTKIQKNRRSIFREEGLEEDFTHEKSQSRSSSLSRISTDLTEANEMPTSSISRQTTTATLDDEINEHDDHHDDNGNNNDNQKREPQEQRRNSWASRRWYTKLTSIPRPRMSSISGPSSGAKQGLQRFTMIAILIAIIIPSLSYRHGNSRVEFNAADAGVIQKRQSPVDVCTRWAHQIALLNSTLYIYGGQAKTEGDQEMNTWNSNFLTLDLTEDWDTDEPAFTGLDLPDGPPAVAMGALWRDYSNLYLYGGQFSTAPYVDVGSESVWQYTIADGTWTEFSDQTTLDGRFSAPGGEVVHRAAEGSTISVPELGLSWYFGGHLDWATTPGWPTQIVRVYLSSLLEFTHPGYLNTNVDELSGDVGAGEQGAFRNITEGDLQLGDFPERADGALVFVPGWGEQGVLIGLAGGREESFVDDLRILDVYDIANSQWFHQETSGDIPGVRVNPCAVIASAPDASSFQIYLFGGQNLPFGEQTQYNDMYILSIPAFTWIQVEKGDGVPSPRAGHTCSMHDGQIVLVGGYVGEDISCDSPGVYVFDASTLSWQDGFTAGDHDADYESGNMVKAGSYGYRVPDVVQSAIGGNEDGGATATEPAAGPATGGPFATGTAPVFTITQSGATHTVTPTSNADDDPPEDSDGDSEDSISPSLIVAGVVAAVFGSLALYLGFCAWLYRRQVAAYKQHIAVTNRYSGASGGSLGEAGLLFGAGRRGRRASSVATGRSSGETFGWVGGRDSSEPQWLHEPKWLFDDATSPTTGSGSGNASGNVSGGSGSTGHPLTIAQQKEYREQQERLRELQRERKEREGGSTEGESREASLDGQEPSFFSVVMGPRRALRVVNAGEPSG